MIGNTLEKRKPGRPKKTESRAERHITSTESAPETAVPVRRRKKKGDHQVGPLFIANQDPDFIYRFVTDRSENGAKIMKMLNKDYEFVTKSEGLEISDSYCYQAGQLGSIYRVAAEGHTDKFLYLMKIRKDWYEEDQAEKEAAVDKQERGLFNPDKKDGQFGLRTEAEGD